MITLVDLLCDYYSSEREIRDALEMLGLNTARIDFQGSAMNIWVGALREARRTGNIDFLVDHIIARFLTRRSYYDGCDDELYQDENNLKRSSEQEKRITDIQKAKDQYLAAFPNFENIEDDKLKLRNRRPGYSIPEDYKSILFKDPYKISHVTTLVDLIGGFQGIETAQYCCAIADYQLDIELVLMEAAEAVAISSVEDPEKQDFVWIRGDEIWRIPTGRPQELNRDDWPILLQIRPKNIDISLEDFLDILDRRLDELSLLFVLDFSRLTINDLIRAQDPAQKARYIEIINGIDFFTQYLNAKNQRIIIGLPRIALSIPEWKSFVDSIPNSFFACELFYSIQNKKKWSNESNDIKQLLPPLLSSPLKSLQHSNSYALNKEMEKEIGEIIKRKSRTQPSKEDQIKELLGIAGKLVNKGFLEPAYRLELWCKRNSTDANFVELQVDIIPNMDDNMYVVKRKWTGC